VQGQVLGVKVEGYAHTKNDELEVERRRAELEKKKAQYQDKDRQQGKDREPQRSKPEQGDDSDAQSMPASEALKLYQKHIEKDATALLAIEQELYMLQKHPQTFTEADAVRLAEAEFSRGRAPKLVEEAKRALVAEEKAERRHTEFVKEKGIGVWLPGNLREERRLSRDLKEASGIYNAKLEEWQAFEKELAKPEIKQQFDTRVRELISAHTKQLERRKELQAKKEELNRKLSPYRKTIEKLKELGDRKVDLLVFPGKGKKVDPEKLNQQIQQLEEEREKKRAKGRGLGL
jgi:hypothetical protein